MYTTMARSMTGKGSLSVDVYAHFNEVGLQGATTITGNINQGTAGAAIDLNQFAGSAGGIVRGQVNGIDVMVGDGTQGIRTTGTGLLTGKATEFIVWVDDDPSLFVFLSSDTGSGSQQRIEHNVNGNWGFNRGGPQLFAGKPDGNIQLIIVQWNNDATSKMSIFGTTSSEVTGDVGNSPAKLISLIGRPEASNIGAGKLCEWAYFDSQLTDSDVNIVKNFLINKWAIVVV